MSERLLRDRLADRGYPGAAIETAVARMRAAGALDEQRAARACARTLVLVRRRGRLRARRELEHMGFTPQTVSDVLDEILDARAEQGLLDHAAARQLRGRNANLSDPAVFRRVQAALIRRGFPPSRVRAALLARLKGHVPDEIDAAPPADDE